MCFNDNVCGNPKMLAKKLMYVHHLLKITTIQTYHTWWGNPRNPCSSCWQKCLPWCRTSCWSRWGERVWRVGCVAKRGVRSRVGRVPSYHRPFIPYFWLVATEYTNLETVSKLQIFVVVGNYMCPDCCCNGWVVYLSLVHVQITRM